MFSLPSVEAVRQAPAVRRGSPDRSRTTSRAVPRWRRRAADRPAEILHAALEEFVEKGFAAARLEDIARRAGVSKGTIYLYYPSKETLFRKIVERVLLPAVSDLEREVEDFPGPTGELVRRLMRHWWEIVSHPPFAGVPKLMVSEAANFPKLARYFVERVVRRVRGLFVRVLKRGVARGEFQCAEPELAARVLMAPLVFAAIWRGSLAPFDREPFDIPAFIELHLDTWLRAVAAPTALRPGGKKKHAS